MSWEVELQCPCCNQSYPSDIKPYNKTEMDVTWNYSQDFRAIFIDGFVDRFDGKSGARTEIDLERGVLETGGKIPDQKDPWNDGNWNPGTVLALMLAWARIYPEGIWRIA